MNSRNYLYVLYDKKDGRILGRYSRFEEEAGGCVQCTPEEVREAMAGLIDSPARGQLEVVEHLGGDQADLYASHIDPKTRKPVAPAGKRRPRVTRK